MSRKKINKSLGIVAAAALIAGGTSQIANAATNKGDISNLKAEMVQKTGNTKASKELNKNILVVKNDGSNIKKDGLYELSVKTLKEKGDSASMAGDYLKKVNYEVKEGNKFLIFSLDSIDWMKNISVTVDGKEIIPTPIDIVKKETDDNKGKQKGKIKFQMSSLDSEIILHMNVVPMGNARVTFRVVPEKGTVKLIKEYKKEVPNNAPILTVGQDLEVVEGTIIDLMKGVKAQDKEDGNLTENIKIDSGKFNVKNPKSGSYEITYSVTDSKGKKVIQRRKIIVKASEKKENKWINVKTVPKVTGCEFGDFYGSIEYRVQFENSLTWGYGENILKVFVNGKELKSGYLLQDGEYYYGGYSTIKFNKNAFPQDVNTIIINTHERNSIKVKIKKDGTFISQEEVKPNIKFNLEDNFTVKTREKIDLLKGVTAKNEKNEDLTSKIKVDSGKLNIDKPEEGKYIVTYTVNNGAEEFVTVRRRVIVVSGNTLNNKLEDGIYTLGFKAYRVDNPDKNSMLQGFFDPKVKAEVKDGKIKLTMLNTIYAYTLYDFRIEDEGVFRETIATNHGKADVNGEYQMQTFEIPITDLVSDHTGCVLVGMMGAQISDIGNTDKYTKLRIVFDKKYEKGWNGFDEDKKVLDPEEEFNKALLAAGFDKDGDGSVTDEEIALPREMVDLSSDHTSRPIEDISRLKHLNSQITQLGLGGNCIKELPKGVFDKLVNLKSLDLASNGITELPEGIFDKLTNLKILSMSHNKIKKLPKGIFDKLTKLEILSINKNQLESLPDDVFEKLTSLKELYLYENNIKKIPTSVSELTKLKTLHINDNKIEKVPVELAKLKNLTKLSLSKNYIKEIPMEIYKVVSKIEKFDISDNQLTTVPSNIKEMLPNTRSINLKLNNLKDMPNISQQWIDNNEFEYYPQKNIFNFKLTAKDGKLTWNQDLSALDLYCWAKVMNKYSRYKTPKDISEYNKILNGKATKDFLNEKGQDWSIITEIQKKDLAGNYVTIKTSSTEEEEDIINGTYNDSEMKDGNEYRIIKTVIGNENRIFSHMATAVASAKDNNLSGNQQIHQEKTKEIEVKVLKEKSNEPSMAGEYVNKTVKYTEKDGKKYLKITLNRLDWMKNVSIEVNGASVVYEEKVNGNVGEFTFEVGNETDEVKMHMNVVPMGNARVSFRLVNSESTLKDQNPNVNPEQSKPEEKPDSKPEPSEQKPKEKNDNKEDIKDNNKDANKDDNKDNIKEDKDIDAKILKVVKNKNLKSGNYKNVQSTIKCKNKEQEKLIKENLEIKTDVTVTKEKDIIVRMELTGKYAFNSKVFVDGKQVDVTEIFKDRTELMASPEIQTESKKDNNKQVVEFKLPNINSKVELVTFDSNKPNEKIQATVNLKNDLVNKSLDKSTLSKDDVKDDVKDNNIKKDKDNKDNNTKDDNNNVKEDNNNKENGNNDVKEDNINNNKEHIYTNEEDPHNKNTSAVNNHDDINKKEIESKSSKKLEQTVKNENKDNEKISTDKKLPKTGLPINTGILASMGTILSGLGIALRKKIKK